MDETKRTETRNDDEWIPGVVAAAILGVSPATLRRWIRDGKIRPRRLSKKYSRDDIERIRTDGTGGAPNGGIPI
tara:strand:- start:2875 stop:3096 length:222 start_codon:yes stop_codon:yes gene_type:complete